MSKNVSLAELYDVMEEMLSSGGSVNFNPRGTSMLPLLHNDGDRVTLERRENVKKYDIPLYRREDGTFVLHRIVGVNKDGTFNMCGDNQWVIEKNIDKSRIIGVVSLIERKGKKISTTSLLYRIYAAIWVAVMPLRHIFIGGARKIKNILFQTKRRKK